MTSLKKQTNQHEQALVQLNNARKEYEVALTTIDVREKNVDEKEADLIIRENHLATQQIQVKIAWDEIKKNASKPTDN